MTDLPILFSAPMVRALLTGTKTQTRRIFKPQPPEDFVSLSWDASGTLTLCPAALACRKAWNNRRMMRGAELFDLIMALRYDREEATKHKVWRIINRMAAKFRDEDKGERAGRRSWQRLRTVLERHVRLVAHVSRIGRKARP